MSTKEKQHCGAPIALNSQVSLPFEVDGEYTASNQRKLYDESDGSSPVDAGENYITF